MFDRKPGEIQQRQNGKRVDIHSSTSEVAMNDFEVLLCIVAFAALCDLMFWG